MVYNSIIPFKGFKCINLFGILFIRKEYKNDFSLACINHEKIHTAQMKELLYIPFYVLYIFEWLYRLILTKNALVAYHNISFEKEAYSHMYNYIYLGGRKHFNMWKK